MRVAVGSIVDFQDGDFRPVRIQGLSVLVGMVRNRYFAISNACPHAGSLLERGSLNGEELTCPRHGAVINVLDGRCVVPEGLPQVPCYQIEVDSGRLYVTV